MRRILRGAAIAAALLVTAYLALAAAVAVAPSPALEAPAAGSSVPGIWHVHAEGSHDGHGTLEEAARAARESGARFLVLTEHNRLRTDLPRVIDGALIVPGVELSAHAGHVVALGVEPAEGAAPATPFVLPPVDRGPEVLASIAAAGGDAVLAHPMNRKRPWTDRSPDGFAGFEALSLDDAWREALAARDRRLLLGAAALAGDRRKLGALLLGDVEGPLARFDELAARRPLALLCAVDAHGLPPYRSSFEALRIHLDLGGRGLDPDPRRAAADVRAAIREGRLFCSVPALGDASAFSFRREGEEVVAAIGGVDGELVLLRDGVEVARGPGPELRAPARAPGAYRAEVRVSPGFPWPDGALWIVASPVRVPVPTGNEEAASSPPGPTGPEASD